MRPAPSALALTLIGSLIPGCAAGSWQTEFAQTRLQVEALRQRVDRLEQLRGGVASSLDAALYSEAATTESGAGQASPSFRAGGAAGKLVRGLANAVTGWVEVPKRVHQTSQASGAAAGFTWGLARGLGYGFIRTVGGVYETVTFPFPAPPDYRPVIQPEYVFLPDPA
jgi:putative exosortase-associated protein (TIGR04073 family)